MTELKHQNFDRLYHYTTTDTLSKILQSRSLRFKKLTTVNDPKDGDTQDLDEAKKFVFSSSWTYEESQSERMWQEYGDESKGVRISASPEGMFKDTSEIKQGNWYRTKQLKYCELDETIYSPAKGIQDGNAINMIFGPEPVDYSGNTPEVFYNYKTCRKYIHIAERGASAATERGLVLSRVGLEKTPRWAYEKEVRFRILYSPQIGAPEGATLEEFLNLIEFKYDHIDIQLSDQFFENLSILPGTKCDYSSVEECLKKHAPSAKILSR